MKIIQDFKAFALRGNVVDMAVGVIIGAAFGKIVTSVIEDIIMPVVARISGGHVDFSNLYIPLSDKVQPGLALAEARKAGPVLAYGGFITIVLNFLILAFVVFLMIKAMNKVIKKEETKPAAPPEPTAQEKLLAEIRDLLKAGR
jgi:large conductance mechanosensitive channel